MPLVSPVHESSALSLYGPGLVHSQVGESLVGQVQYAQQGTPPWDPNGLVHLEWRIPPLPLSSSSSPPPLPPPPGEEGGGGIPPFLSLTFNYRAVVFKRLDLRGSFSLST